MSPPAILLRDLCAISAQAASYPYYTYYTRTSKVVAEAVFPPTIRHARDILCVIPLSVRCRS